MKVREITIKGDVAYVPLTKGYVAIIDADDAHLVDKFNWCADVKRGIVYASRSIHNNGEKIHVYLHRFLMENIDGFQIDHIDGDGLNNRRFNLRVVTAKENMQNMRKARNGSKSGLIGAVWDECNKKWRSQIRARGIRINIGLFDSAEKAHQAYLKAKRELHTACTI